MTYTEKFIIGIIEEVKAILPNNSETSIKVPINIESKKGVAELINRMNDRLMVTIRFKEDIEVGNLKSLSPQEIVKIANQLL